MNRADVYDRVRQWWDTTVLAGGAQLYCEPGGRTVDVVVAVTHGLAMRLILMQVQAAAGGGQE
jgi:broad specificity phosphatase PhoE